MAGNSSQTNFVLWATRNGTSFHEVLWQKRNSMQVGARPPTRALHVKRCSGGRPIPGRGRAAAPPHLPGHSFKTGGHIPANNLEALGGVLSGLPRQDGVDAVCAPAETRLSRLSAS